MFFLVLTPKPYLIWYPNTLFYFAKPFIYIDPSQTSEMHQLKKLSPLSAVQEPCNKQLQYISQLGLMSDTSHQRNKHMLWTQFCQYSIYS